MDSYTELSYEINT